MYGGVLVDIKLPFGLKDNILVHISEISEADRGLKCDCVCPGCRMKLNARLGNKNRHHFAHHNDNCKSALETALHLFAKETLEKHKRIRLPEIEVTNYVYFKNVEDFGKRVTQLNWDEHDLEYIDQEAYTKVMLVVEKNLQFDSIEFEKRIDAIIPDIVIYYKEAPLIVEIGVTHFIDNKKEKKIRALGISAIEINLSKIDYYKFDRLEIENLIVDGLDNKNWVYNRVAEAKKKELAEKNKLALMELKKQENIELERRKIEQMRIAKLKDNKTKTIEALLLNSESKLNEYREMYPSNRLWIDFCNKYKVSDANLPVFLNEAVNGEIAFACDRRVWQSCIFEKFILNRKEKSVMVGNVVRWLSKHSSIPLNKEFVYTKEVDSNIPDLAATIHNYLLKLTEYGFLDIEKNRVKFYANFLIKHDKLTIPEKVYNELNRNSCDLNFYRGREEYCITPYDEVVATKEAVVATKEAVVNNRTTSIGLYEKVGKCIGCGKMTTDWITFNGADNSCVCRSCRYSGKE